MESRTEGEPLAGQGPALRVAPPRVLLADDDPDLLDIIASALRAHGFEVLEAPNGARLLDIVAPSLLDKKAAPPAEVVISDLRMPGLTGLSVLAGLRQLDWKMPFILMTAFGDAETHEQARQLGAVAVLDKPFEIHKLLGLIWQALGVAS